MLVRVLDVCGRSAGSGPPAFCDAHFDALQIRAAADNVMMPTSVPDYAAQMLHLACPIGGTSQRRTRREGSTFASAPTRHATT